MKEQQKLVKQQQAQVAELELEYSHPNIATTLIRQVTELEQSLAATRAELESTRHAASEEDETLAMQLAHLYAVRRSRGVLQGNFADHKRFMESLKQDPTGRSCLQTVARYRGDRAFRPGTPDARMLDVVANTCCKPSGG